MNNCSVPQCPTPSKIRGLCSKHYQKWRKYGNPLASASKREFCSKGSHPWVAENQRVNGKNADGTLKYICKICQQERHREKNFNRYGLTTASFESMLAAQDNHCALCPAQFTHAPSRIAVRLHVDHNHTTGEVRGLLCGRCNLLVGLVESIPNAPTTLDVLNYLRA